MHERNRTEYESVDEYPTFGFLLMKDSSGMRTTTGTQINAGRKYKSRKERP